MAAATGKLGPWGMGSPAMNLPTGARPEIAAARHEFDPQAAYRDYQRQRPMTLADLLLENRVIFLQGEIWDGIANELVMK
jgi:ATP-dependent Clp protease protease subunit